MSEDIPRAVIVAALRELERPNHYLMADITSPSGEWMIVDDDSDSAYVIDYETMTALLQGGYIVQRSVESGAITDAGRAFLAARDGEAE